MTHQTPHLSHAVRIYRSGRYRTVIGPQIARQTVESGAEKAVESSKKTLKTDEKAPQNNKKRTETADRSLTVPAPFVQKHHDEKKLAVNPS